MKKTLVILAVILVLFCSMLPCFALDQQEGYEDYEVMTYLGLDSIEVYNYYKDITQQHQLTFYNQPTDNVFAFPITLANSKQNGFLEYRPMRTVNLAPYPWTETRCTFKGDFIQFNFSDISLDLVHDVDFQMVELLPYSTNYDAVIDVEYHYTIVDYMPNGDGGFDIREQSYTETQYFNQSSANGGEIIYLFPTFHGVINTNGKCYLKELTTMVPLVRPNDSTSLKFDMHGKTEKISENGLKQYFDTIDFQPNAFSLATLLLTDISSMLAVEIFPNFSLGAMLAIVCGVPLLIMVLKLFLGG